MPIHNPDTDGAEMPRTRWEYLMLESNTRSFWGPTLDSEELESTLNQCGAEGWELVSVLDINAGQGSTAKVAAFLKRSIE